VRLTEAIAALIQAIIADGRSPKTAETYRGHLRYLVDFLGDVEIETITVDQLRAYAVDLRQRGRRWSEHPHHDPKEGGLSPFTVASYVNHAKRLFNWLYEEGLLTNNPAARLKRANPPRHGPKGISTEDFKKLLRATAGQTLYDLRARALILFLADTGARRGGVERLKIDDLDLANMRALVTEKGERSRFVFFSPVTRDALKAWLDARPNKGPWVFVALGPKGEERMTGDAIRTMLERLGKRAGCTGPINPHAFRHGFARDFILNGGGLSELADILGHKALETTREFYAIFQIGELQRVHRRFSPVARLGENEDV